MYQSPASGTLLCPDCGERVTCYRMRLMAGYTHYACRELTCCWGVCVDDDTRATNEQYARLVAVNPALAEEKASL